MIERYEHRLQLSADTSLALVSSLFLGLGILVASRLQFVDPLVYQRLQVYLYGQAATMTDHHLYVYALLALLCIGFIGMKFRQLELLFFDRKFAESLPYKRFALDGIFMVILILIIIFSIRSSGIVLMSGMLIAPAIAARQLTDRFSHLLIFSACFGMASALGGNVLALYLPFWLGKQFALPTGPMIVLTAATLCALSLVVAPKRGALFRFTRMLRFRFSCLCENLLKDLWRQKASEKPLAFAAFTGWQHHSFLLLRCGLLYLCRKGWVEKNKQRYSLTARGLIRATQLVRLHRLWELYLTSKLNIHQDRVHRNAEEIEHILTPDLEKKLTQLLDDPDVDPHQQPIPKWEDVRC